MGGGEGESMESRHVNSRQCLKLFCPTCQRGIDARTLRSEAEYYGVTPLGEQGGWDQCCATTR